jgi:light-regulated signal transduction histidine kinase (bacteriophytochrome)
LISKVHGASFEEKVENSDTKLRTLYHAIDLLDNRLKMMPLISNPDAAKYGQVSKCSPYKLFDKVCRLFYDTANTNSVTINLVKDKYITYEPLVYDSFLTIPFILIENAIKYSQKKSIVEIHLKQKNKSVYIDVVSYGPVVSTENTEKIFEKGFKDPNAKKFSSKGSGIGLYLAKLVADAHNFEIQYRKENCKFENDIELGKNVFSFELKN